MTAGCGRESNPKSIAPSDAAKGAETKTGGNTVDSASKVEANPSTTEFEGLDQSKQKYIWDLEHFTFELESRFFKHVASALKDKDNKALRRFFRDEFQAQILDPSQRTKGGKEYLSQVEQTRSDDNRRSATAEALVSHLMGYLDGFERIQSLKFRVLQIDAERGDVKSGLWKLKVLFMGTGEDNAGGPLAFDSLHEVQCRFVEDDDIVLGQILVGWDVLSESLRRGKAKLMVEATERMGLAQIGMPDNWKVPPEERQQYLSQYAVADFDGDGFLDIAGSSSTGRLLLLKNKRGERFEDVAKEFGLPNSDLGAELGNLSYLAAWIDLENDGFPDLLLGSSLYANRQGRRFEDITPKSGLKLGYDPMGAVVADYDADGLNDLYILYQHAPKSKRSKKEKKGWVGDNFSGVENRLWRNRGEGTLEDVTAATKTGGGPRHSFAAAWFHANDDAWPDLYVANDFGTNTLLINRGQGVFEDQTDRHRVGSFATSMGVATGDITGDGQPEIYVANMFSKMGRRIIAHVGPSDYPEGVYEQIRGSCAGNQLYTTTREGEPYREISDALGVNAVGWAYAPALVDFDGDGWLDIYGTAGFMSYEPSKPDG